MKRVFFLTTLILSLGFGGPVLAEGYDAEGGYNWFGDYDDESRGVLDQPGPDYDYGYENWVTEDYDYDYGDIDGDIDEVGLEDDWFTDDYDYDYDYGTDDDGFEDWYDD